MSNPTIEDLVLNYVDYSTITKKFGTNRDYVFDTKYDVVLEYAKVDNPTKKKYDKTYKEVYRHLHSSGVMFDYMVQGCKYISYLIHKDVKKTLYLYYDEEIFKIFRKFVEDYYNRTGSSTSTCLPHIVYVNHDMYAKLDTIYELYNQYNVLSMNRLWDDTKCLSLKFFITLYNDYMKNKRPNSSKLIQILKPFETRVTNTINGLDGKCSKYTYPLEKIEQYKPPEKEESHHIPKLTPLEPQALEHPVETRIERAPNTEVTQLALSPSIHSASELGSITAKSDIEQDVERELGSRTGPESVIEEITVSEPQAQGLRYYGTHITHQRNETMGQSGYRPTVQSSEKLKLMGEQPLYPQNGLEKDHGVMANVRNTITEVLGSVEPAPILGVSGGMGALFLLFKYTPVGTFFRGGRRINNRIPRTFYGQFPGGLTGYDELYGGALGSDPINISYRAGME